ncbi:unnamed protein product [Gongylonema pulchrum]|uniref:C2H2-type domain-containing protein n=1 Tax=Gongylonema pulchrum TaxID=637853 RepID=A0A183DUC4_9BILA|nr:unnamed protein product [Gongylonema pulchrum]
MVKLSWIRWCFVSNFFVLLVKTQTKDAFLERSDVRENSSFCSIFPSGLLDDVALASQFSLSVPTEEDLYVLELDREQPDLLETLWDAICRPPAILHAEAATTQPSLQSMPREKTERSLAGNYWCPEASPTCAIELNNYTQDCPDNSAYGQRSIPEGQYVTPTTQHCTIHNGEKPYKCSHCNSKFRQKAHLDEHMRIHSGEKPYVCEHCGKRFRSIGNLQQHYTIHTGKSRTNASPTTK